MSTRLLRAAGAAVLLLSACSKDFDGQVPCASDLECQTGAHCLSGKCVSGNSPPHLVFDSPAASTYLAGSVDVKISADDPEAVRSVALATSDGKALGTFTAPGAAFGQLKAEQLTITIDTTKLSDGKVTLQATGTDGLGASGVGATRDVNVANTTVTAGTVTVTPDPAKKSAQLSIAFSTSGPSSAASVTVAGNAATQTSKTAGTPGDAYVFGYTVSGNEPAGAAAIVVTVANLAGVTTTKNASVTLVFTPPAAPTFSGSTPATPAKSTAPLIKGTAAAGSTVSLYTNATCTGTPAATGTAAVFTSPGIAVTVPDNATTTFHATATDAAGNVSACSSASLDFRADSIAPAVPVFTGTAPASPSNSTAPRVLGTAEALSTVRLYSAATCPAGALLVTGAASAAGAFDLAITAPPNTTLSIYATATDLAGNASACTSTPAVYVSDQTPPSVPTPTGTNPPSPNNSSLQPLVQGTVATTAGETPPTVQLFSDPACSAANQLATGSATTFAGPGLQITVQANHTTTIYAKAIDPAGNASACSTAFISYTHDNIAPAAPGMSATSPANQGMTTGPLITGTAEAGSTVKLYASASCNTTPIGTGSALLFGTTGIAASVPANASATIYAAATDAANNTSPCSSASVTFVSTLPSLFSTSVPASPSTSTTVTVSGTADTGSTVTLWDNAGCAGTPLGSGGADVFATGLANTVPLPTDAANKIYASATLPGLAASGCSTTWVDYVTDNTAPAPPVMTGISPTPPAMTAQPLVSGTSEAGSVVLLFTTSDCSGAPVGVGSEAQFSSTGVAAVLTVGAQNLYALAKDAAGNASTCVSAPSFIVTVPTVSSTNPASPSLNLAPAVLGTSDTGTTVTLYTDSACAGPTSGSGADGQFAAPGITVAPSLASNSSVTFYATATIPGFAPSPCSTTSVFYTADNTPPAAPSGLSVLPGATAMTTGPKLKGTAEAGSTVKVYSAAGCGSGLLGSIGAAAFAATGFTATVTAGGTSSFYFTATDVAGNTSPCTSTALTFTSTVPVVSSVTPIPPAKSTAPKVIGTADASSTVQLYTDAACATSAGAGANGTNTAFASPGIAATVGANSTTTFYAKATISGFAASGCSTTFASYVADNTAPANPTFTSISPGTSAMTTAPVLKGTAEAGSTVTLYNGATCATSIGSGTAAAFAGAGLTATVTANATTQIYAIVTDQATNTSACTLLSGFTSTVPTVSSVTPASPAKSTSPKLLGAADSGSTVQLYTDAACTVSAGAGANGTAAVFANPGIGATVGANSTTSFYAKATLSGFAASGCSTTFVTYVADNTAPANPTFTSISPGTTAMTTGPVVKGTADAGSTVTLYSGSSCATPLGSGSAAAFSSTGIVATVPSNTTLSIYAVVTDQATNASACTLMSNFTSTVPTVSSTNPASPGVTTTPKVLGSADAGSTVTVYSNASCTTSVASGTAATFTTGITVSAETNNTQNTYWANATLPGFAASGCSITSVTYTNDQQEAAPTLVASTPASPSNSTAGTIAIRGTTTNVEPPGSPSTIYFYLNDATCNGSTVPGTSIANGSQTTFTGATGIPVPLVANQTVSYYALSHDGTGRNSACVGPFTFTSVQYCAAANPPGAQVFSPTVQGCAGTVTFANRANLCAAGAHVCNADEFAAFNGGNPPAHHYWTDEVLNYSLGAGVCGSAACNVGNCFATVGSVNAGSCGATSPMRVCKPGAGGTTTDPEGNVCNWTSCGYNTVSPSEGFGGCGSASAGTVCCSGPHRYYVDAVNGTAGGAGTSGSPFKTITKGLGVAVSGDTVYVKPGVYDATNGETFPLTVPAGVFLLGDEPNRGAGSTPTRINGCGTFASNPYAVVVNNNATVAGFILTCTSSYIVAMPSSGATLRNNSITGASIWAVVLNSNGFTSGTNNQILLNSGTGNGFTPLQINTSASTSVKVENNTFTGNQYGIEIGGGAPAAIDLGGGALGSVGNNVFSCNTQSDIGLFGSPGTLSAANNRWDHSTATFPAGPTVSTTNGGGVDIFNSGGQTTLVTTNAALAPSPCGACASTAVAAQVFDNNMIGCTASGAPAAVAYANRATLCPSGSHVCTAAEWVLHHGATAPNVNYWSGDNPLNELSFTAQGNCSVSATAGSNGCSGGAMLICPSSTSFCNTYGCGLDNNINNFLGGCSVSSGAGQFSFAGGSVCCVP